MIFLVSVLSGIVAGFLLKGKTSGLTNMAFRHVWLLLIFFLLDVFMNSRFSESLSAEAYRPLVLMLLILQYAALLAFSLINRTRWPIWVIGFGELMNFFVILANKGKMPVDVTDMPASSRLDMLLAGKIPHYGALHAQTRFPFLGDVIPFRLFSPSMISVGDLLIMGGLFLLMVHAMKNRNHEQTSAHEHS